MSWEDELDDLEKDEKNEKKGKKGKKEKKDKIALQFDDECQEIKVTKQVQPETIKPKDKGVDYEALYQQRKQKDIEIEKEIEESIKNIQDPELKLKKKLELMELKRAEKFLNLDDEKKKVDQDINLDFPLRVEKDYIELATKTAALINNVGKGNKYTLEFLKASFEQLLLDLPEDEIGDLIKTIKIISTKKNKEKGGKKKKEKTEPKKEAPAAPKDKMEERKGLYKQYGDGDIGAEPNPDDYNDDGDFM